MLQLASLSLPAYVLKVLGDFHRSSHQTGTQSECPPRPDIVHDGSGISTRKDETDCGLLIAPQVCNEAGAKQPVPLCPHLQGRSYTCLRHS
jgi:hypothetical protein